MALWVVLLELLVLLDSTRLQKDANVRLWPVAIMASLLHLQYYILYQSCQVIFLVRGRSPSYFSKKREIFIQRLLVLYRLPIQLFMAFMASSSTSQVVNVISVKCSPNS